MNLKDELKIYYDAFYNYCQTYSNYWVNVATHIEAFQEFCNNTRFLTQTELKIHIDEIENYVAKNNQEFASGNLITGETKYRTITEVSATEDKRNKIKIFF